MYTPPQRGGEGIDRAARWYTLIMKADVAIFETPYWKVLLNIEDHRKKKKSPPAWMS